MNFKIVLLLGVMVLSGCSFREGEGLTEQNRKIQDQLTQAEDGIAPILGRWAGTLTRGTNLIPIELEITKEQTDTGARTENGQTIYRIDPKATIRSTTDSRYTYSFKGTYYKEKGRIVFTNPGATSSDDFTSMDLLYSNGSIGGSVTAKTYTVGTILVTRQASPSNGEEQQDEEERTYAQDRAKFEPLVGKWTGDVRADAGNENYKIFLTITMPGEQTPTGRIKPSLRAYYYRSDIGEDVVRRTLYITYNYRTEPPTISMTSLAPSASAGGTGASVPNPGGNYYVVNIIGRFVPNADGSPNLSHITGTHFSVNQGITGTLDLWKDGSRPTPPKPPVQPKPPVKPPRKR